MRFRSASALFFGAAVLLAGCDAFGSKDDATTDEIFEQGQIDPTLVDDVGYVPLLPFYTNTLAGTFDRPLDVAVGFDELLYVPDANGLHVLDLAGRPQAFVDRVGGQELRFERRAGTPGLGGELDGPQTSVVQDRRLHLYIAARRDTTIGGTLWDLPVVYRLSNVGMGSATVEDIIWYPFDDGFRQGSERSQNPRAFYRTLRDPVTGEVDTLSVITDEQIDFTGIGVLPNNGVYIASRGLLNSGSLDARPNDVLPFNAIVEYGPDGQYRTNLNFDATQASLESAVFPSDLITPIAPPQTTNVPNDLRDFLLAQRPPASDPTYGVLAIETFETINGLEYQPVTDLVNAAANPDNGDGFLFEEFKFDGVTDLALGRDAAGLLFVTDAEKDSLFVFNPNGVEGVTLSTTGSLRPVPVSFGGFGSGPTQFAGPQGVAYLGRTVYVADTGNNRISRYRLNTDFE